MSPLNLAALHFLYRAPFFPPMPMLGLASVSNAHHLPSPSTTESSSSGNDTSATSDRFDFARLGQSVERIEERRHICPPPLSPSLPASSHSDESEVTSSTATGSSATATSSGTNNGGGTGTNSGASSSSSSLTSPWATTHPAAAASW